MGEHDECWVHMGNQWFGRDRPWLSRVLVGTIQQVRLTEAPTVHSWQRLVRLGCFHTVAGDLAGLPIDQCLTLDPCMQGEGGGEKERRSPETFQTRPPPGNAP